MNSIELQKRVDLAKAISQKAGECLLAFVGRLEGHELKGAVDLVTSADRASEALLVGHIRRLFPRDAILAEEGGHCGAEESRWGWVLDPLDGTTNFVHQVPRYAVSIGLTFDQRPVAGIIFDPSQGDLHWAVQGQGAFTNDSQIHVSTASTLAQSLLVTGFPYDRLETADALCQILARVLRVGRGVRRLGAASLDFVDVARGVFAGYWEERLAPWDMAAGVVLVREAGGSVTTFGGDLWSLESPSVLASNGTIHDALRECVAPPGVIHG